MHAAVGKPRPACTAHKVACALPVAAPLAVDAFGVRCILHDLAHLWRAGRAAASSAWEGLLPLQILLARREAGFKRSVGARRLLAQLQRFGIPVTNVTYNARERAALRFVGKVYEHAEQFTAQIASPAPQTRAIRTSCAG